MLLLTTKLVLLYACLGYLQKFRKPLGAALIYSVGSLLITWVFQAAGSASVSGLNQLAFLIGFFFDFGVAVAIFGLVNRYRARVPVFFGAILVGVVINSVGQYWLSEAMEQKELLKHAAAPSESSNLTFPPHLWSHHKSLQVSAETCAGRALAALNAYEFTSVVRNGTYSYGNSGANRAALKCVERGAESSFVYIAVAGPDKSVVEDLRNKLARSL
ncbi:MAG: hypothetical protein ACQEV6_01700 [Pseudomonadota bacterium]